MDDEGRSAAPGWYNDAAGKVRWWDGRSWTEHVAPAPTTAPASPVKPPSQTAATPAAPNTSELSEVPTAPGLKFPKVHRKARAALRQNLSNDERVQVVIVGPSDQAIFGTERRAFVFKKGFMAGASFGSEMTSWEYRNLTGVQLHTGMMSGAVVLQGPGQTGHSISYWGNGNSDPYKAPNAIPVVRPFPPIASAVAELRKLIDDAHVAPDRVASASAGPPALTEQLRQLADLHRDGVLNDLEFAAAKARLLET